MGRKVGKITRLGKGKFIDGKQKVSFIHLIQQKKYIESATPNLGSFSFDNQYNIEKHKEEYETAKWMHSNLGGDIKLLSESEKYGVKMPDYNWRGKLWELKTVTTEKSADSAVRQALKQILNNPGGVILDYKENNIIISELEKIIESRVKRSAVNNVDIMILSKGKIEKVISYKK